MKAEELMINDTVKYAFGNKILTGTIIGIKITIEIMSGERVGVFRAESYTVKDVSDGAIRSNFNAKNFDQATAKWLEQLRKAIKSENISYSEIAELQQMIKYIPDNDVALLQWAGKDES